MIDDKVECGEKVSAVLKSATTGEKRVIDGETKVPKYRVEVKITDLQTGEVHKYEATR